MQWKRCFNWLMNDPNFWDLGVIDERILMFDGRARAEEQVLLPIWGGFHCHNPQCFRRDDDTRFLQHFTRTRFLSCMAEHLVAAGESKLLSTLAQGVRGGPSVSRLGEASGRLPWACCCNGSFQSLSATLDDCQLPHYWWEVRRRAAVASRSVNRALHLFSYWLGGRSIGWCLWEHSKAIFSIRSHS